MTSASYGRMRAGRCIGVEYGFVGCYSDVLPQLDQACSGRQTCEYTIRKLMDIAQPCPRDLTSYLEATHTCLKGKSVCLFKQFSIQHFQPYAIRFPNIEPKTVLIRSLQFLYFSSHVIIFAAVFVTALNLKQFVPSLDKLDLSWRVSNHFYFEYYSSKIQRTALPEKGVYRGRGVDGLYRQRRGHNQRPWVSEMSLENNLRPYSESQTDFVRF